MPCVWSKAVIEYSHEEPVTRAIALQPPFNEILGTPVTTKRADARSMFCGSYRLLVVF